MTTAKVYRDESGKVINIGEWDVVEMPVVDELTQEFVMVEQNPLPDSATFKDEEIVIVEGGGLAAANP